MQDSIKAYVRQGVSWKEVLYFLFLFFFECSTGVLNSRTRPRHRESQKHSVVRRRREGTGSLESKVGIW